MIQRYLILDYETRSKADLKQVGAWEYSVHKSTEVLCVAWRIGTRETLRDAKTHAWAPRLGLGRPDNLVKHLKDPNVIIVAHNALFEQVITANVLPKHVGRLPSIPVERWRCTAALAAAHALPRNLDGACTVLDLRVKKDPMGKLLIRRHCIPRKPTKKNPNIWNNDAAGLKALTDYCVTDIGAETELFLTLPPLTPTEQMIWQLNQKLNLRGVYVDRDLVVAALGMIADETRELTRLGLKLTGGIAPTKVKALKEHLDRLGCRLPNMQAKTIADAISSGLATGRARRLLQIRQAVSKTSTAKYEAFDQRSRSDSRLRDLQLYHGASTGREAGMGVQPHNFPRGSLDDVNGAIEAILSGGPEARAWVRALYGAPLAALSSCLRGVFRATPGFELFCGDFNAIEARVVFWLAGHQTGLGLFGDGGLDPYREMAAAIYGVRVEDVTPEQREVGKRAILGCGFGMGEKKFAETCKTFGQPITPELAKRAVQAYRTKHRPVVLLWSNLEKAAIAATRNPGKRFTINKTTWFVRGKFLYCELPSGRRLAYFGPEVRQESKWDRPRDVLYHWGVDPKTKQWVCTGTYGGKLTENVVQAVARDLMMAGQLAVSAAGYIPLINVHDEILTERKKGRGRLDEFETLMATVPPWAKGMPLKVKGWTGDRYKK